jgi:EAL and modified HD-GYP domain-containing signal transduction protein
MDASLAEQPPPAGPTTPALAVCVGRQPIYDAQRKIFAYELLFRNPGGAHADFPDGDEATARVILNALLDIGIDKIAGSEPVFLNCTRRFLEQDPVIPPDRCVLEILETVSVDAELIAAVARLKERGYRIALDDFVLQDSWRPLVKMADIIKVDVLALTRRQLRDQIRALRPYRKILLAEKVDSEEQLRFCRDLGFQLFQGYFLRRPESVAGRRVPVSKLSLLSVISECRNPDVDLARLALVISGDPSLSYKLLQIANSAIFARRARIESIRQAVASIGTDELLRWATLLIIAGFRDSPPAYLAVALQRARMCELLALERRCDRSDRYYIVGLFSMLDAMLGLPLQAVLDPLPLSPEIKDALLTHQDDLGRVLSIVLDYEAGAWRPEPAAEVNAAVVQKSFWAAAEYANHMTAAAHSAASN